MTKSIDKFLKETCTEQKPVVNNRKQRFNHGKRWHHKEQMITFGDVAQAFIQKYGFTKKVKAYLAWMAQERKKDREQSEFTVRHHIAPYESFPTAIKCDPADMVVLTFNQHKVAHAMLSEIYAEARTVMMISPEDCKVFRGVA